MTHKRNYEMATNKQNVAKAQLSPQEQSWPAKASVQNLPQVLENARQTLRNTRSSSPHGSFSRAFEVGDRSSSTWCWDLQPRCETVGDTHEVYVKGKSTRAILERSGPNQLRKSK